MEANFTAKMCAVQFLGASLTTHPMTNHPPIALKPPWPEQEQGDDEAAQDPHGGTQMVQAPMHRIPSTWGRGNAKD